MPLLAGREIVQYDPAVVHSCEYIDIAMETGYEEVCCGLVVSRRLGVLC